MNVIPLYLGPDHACGYLPDRMARTACVPPDIPLNRSLYSLLAANGFRRSGDQVYRPHCADCRACIPVRIPVREFQPNRSQRRIGKLNAGLRVIAKSAEYDDEHYRLYARYLEARHPDSGMGQPDPDDYIRFLGNSGWLDSVFFEFREGDTLLAVSVVDRLKEGLSAVYTFYDPVMERRSLGTYAILLSFFLVSLRKLAYVQPYDSYVRLVTPFLRLNISYRRFVHASSAEMGRLFSVEDLKGWKRDFLHPLAGETAIVLELKSWPLPRRVLKLFLSPFFFPDRTAARIALLVPDWMKFSTELESLRSTWIDSLLRPDRAPQSDLFASLSDNP